MSKGAEAQTPPLTWHMCAPLEVLQLSYSSHVDHFTKSGVAVLSYDQTAKITQVRLMLLLWSSLNHNLLSSLKMSCLLTQEVEPRLHFLGYHESNIGSPSEHFMQDEFEWSANLPGTVIWRVEVCLFAHHAQVQALGGDW